MDDSPRMRVDGDLRTRTLADLIHEVTEPPGGDVPVELLLTKPAPYLAIGLLQGCRNFLVGACALFDADRESAIPPLARSAMEFSVTGAWLLRNPVHNVKRFLRAQLHEAELLSETDAGEAQLRRDGVLSAFGRFIPRDERTAKELPSFKKRLGPEMETLYRHYRFLSEEVHPSFVASNLAYRVNVEDEEASDSEEGPFITYDVPSRGESGDYLAFILEFTWILAAELQRHLGHGFPPALEAAGRLLWSSRYDEETFERLIQTLRSAHSSDSEP